MHSYVRNVAALSAAAYLTARTICGYIPEPYSMNNPIHAEIHQEKNRTGRKHTPKGRYMNKEDTRRMLAEKYGPENVSHRRQRTRNGSFIDYYLVRSGKITIAYSADGRPQSILDSKIAGKF